MKILNRLFIALVYFLSAQAVLGSNQTLTWTEMVTAYKQLDAKSIYMQLQVAGYTDAGRPLHLMVVNKSGNFKPQEASHRKEAVWLIMNGIHPGESEGIDASLQFLQHLAAHPEEIPGNTTLLIIPCYNVDGMVNRKKYTRCGQNGPDEKGFRGSAQSLDLNRDFLKADSRNTWVFQQIFRTWDPELFLDTHTSNGADYTYTMTLISTQKDKLGGPAATYLYDTINPYLYSNMKQKGYEMVPYVNVFGKSPDDGGYSVFIESPMFSSGYAALFGCPAFVAETHMLKPYPERVRATLLLLETFLSYIQNHSSELVQLKVRQRNYMNGQKEYASNFKVDNTKPRDLLFKGYALELQPSTLGNYERHYYNRQRPYEKTIPYFETCTAGVVIPIPDTLILPAQWRAVAERLKNNKVIYREATGLEDSQAVQIQYLNGATDNARLYEGHYVHKPFQTKAEKGKVKLNKGDLLIPTRQAARFYLMEVLSAETQDGFLCWNFFDGILSEKEGFSDYVFEDEAIDMLKGNAALAEDFKRWKTENPDKISNKYEVLGWLYRHSPYYEREYMRFPVYSK